MKVLVLLSIFGLAVAEPLVAEPVPEAVYGEEAYDNPEENSGLFEGDIDLLPGENPMHRNAIADRRRRWANGIVPYEIQSSYPETVKNIFHQAMNEIETRTKVNGKTCIHFKPHAGEKGFVKFVTGTGCHTPVGYIGRQSSVTIGHGCERKGTVMHELLHALGFWHEQSRTDRDNYVTIDFSNIQKGHEGNFNKYPVGYIDMLGQPYDYGSIMHYSAYAFAIDRSRKTITPKQSGVTIGQRVRLSDTDVKEIQLLYDCIQSTSGSQVTGFVTAPPITTARPPTGSDVCTFQHNFCHWTEPHSDQNKWVRHKGTTPSSHTGPTNDAHGSSTGYYIYVEASGHKSQVSKIDSKLFAGGDYCVDFYYNMYGSDMGYLRLNVIAGTHMYHLKQWSGNHGDHWVHQKMNAHIHTSGTFKFEFEAHTGNSYHSDIALDDIIIHPGNC
ncbi:zinc metalloproteinase nas-13-like [Ruditapes philippinarum]|uniref:zinc metalloproteinase nas-13-like n=1 Tax=Ruditapes philippinarum TaxID=129788 RepID=UPI00295AD66F|nr:zinc metalloproteinase nas-13-like [Ruditapes philippinarum]